MNKKIRIKTIILDFDGTIADTKDSIIQTIQATLDELGIQRANESGIKNLIGLPLRETFVRVAHLMDRNMQEKAIVLYREKYNQISLNTVKLFPDVKETLKGLHDNGLTIAVASGKGKEALLNLLDRMGIARYISLVFGEQDVKNKKPAPDMALLILEKTNSSPQETLVVGDTVYDMAMGQEAGCITCGVSYGNHTEEQLKSRNPDFIIGKFTEITSIIGEIHQL
ncbi:HAD family hydrolase [Dysgonomonas termitidis]|uniref:phosphoglycolate phosphatase n=1 Tax=Dysgonomonas termitidis TaxID=1516126 RepID=A0ABV9L3C4_9BACT